MKSELKRKGGWLWCWTKRFFVRIAALVLILAVSGAIYQYLATRSDEQRFFPSGKMVDVGGYKMHINCTGEGSPTVVLDNGLSFGSSHWGIVPQEIEKFTRVCTFDRAGIGWSEASPHGRGVNQISEELHDLLEKAGERKPFVLSGHSIGGLYVQNYANQYPEEVAGVLLIDSSHAEQSLRILGQAPPPIIARLIKVLAPIGVVRLGLGVRADGMPQMSEEGTAMRSSTKHLYATADEILAVQENFRILRENPLRLGDKPLIVLTRDLSVKPNYSEEDIRANEIWKELQADLASRSSNGKQIVAEKAGHFIYADEPELVLDAIRRLVEAARK